MHGGGEHLLVVNDGGGCDMPFFSQSRASLSNDRVMQTCHKSHDGTGGFIILSSWTPLRTKPCQGSTVILVSHCELPEIRELQNVLMILMG